MRLILFAMTVFAVFPALSRPSAAVDLDAVTVFTLARDGSWGVATAGSLGPAIAAAMRDCRAMSGAPSDCGAQFATSRGGWVVARLCGDHKIMETGETREAAEQAALVREMALKRLYACTRTLTVDPHGVVVPSQSAPMQTGARREEP